MAWAGSSLAYLFCSVRLMEDVIVVRLYLVAGMEWN